MSNLKEVTAFATRVAILERLEGAYNIKYEKEILRALSTEHRMLVILDRQAEVINKLIEKNNKLANAVVGPQKPQTDKNGIILLGG